MIPIERTEAFKNGKTRFFTGKPCRNGHVCERRTCDGKCVDCKDAILNRWIASHRERSNELKQRYADRNAEKIKLWQLEYRKNNPEKLASKRRAEYPKWKEYFLKYGRKWRKKNRTKFNARTRKYFAENVNARLALNMRGRIYKAIIGEAKSASTVALLGCSIDAFKIHLSFFFTEGMSFENYGKWQVDHVIPCSLFDLTKESEQRVCFNFRNCRPMWAGHNAAKGNKLLDSHSEFLITLRRAVLLEPFRFSP